jgi:putative membrane protein
MKNLGSICAIALAACAFAACNNTQHNSVAKADSVNKSKDTSTHANALATNTDDAKFAVEAANGGMAEVELGKIAEQKATNPRVKKFAEMMVMDHSKANEELMSLAKVKNITLPKTCGPDEQKTINDLSKKSAKDFDKAYVDDMVSDHKKDVKKFQDAIKDAKDPDVKAFATKTLPVLQTHLDSITAIQKSMK